MRIAKLLFFVFLVAGYAGNAYSQPDASEPGPGRIGSRGVRPSLDVNGMLARQRTERNKKDHREMLERGDRALQLANQLETSFSQNKNLSSEDRTKLDSLQDTVEKIRKELGGADDERVDDESYMKPVDEVRPSTMEEAFKYLHTTTIKLVDELKKTTRFTISVIAIQSSNNVIRLVKFLRLRK